MGTFLTLSPRGSCAKPKLWDVARHLHTHCCNAARGLPDQGRSADSKRKRQACVRRFIVLSHGKLAHKNVASPSLWTIHKCKTHTLTSGWWDLTNFFFLLPTRKKKKNSLKCYNEVLAASKDFLVGPVVRTLCSQSGTQIPNVTTLKTLCTAIKNQCSQINFFFK